MSREARDAPQFYLTAPSACPYLPGQQERKIFTHLVGKRAAALNDLLTQTGFRRSQTIAYRPACESCRACVSVRVLVAAIWFASIVLTLGLALFFLHLTLWPIVAFFYNGLTVSGYRMATPGMRAMDLEMRMHDTGARVPFVNAAVQAVLFYLSWCFPPIFLASLVDSEKRCLHDIIAGVVIVRRL